AEQGIGDTLQFVRYLPLMAARGGRVLLQCAEELHGLLGALPGLERTVGWGEFPADCDCQAPLLELPRLFATRPDAVPAAVPYLAAPEERRRRWRERLAGDGLRVGLVWAGN